MLYYLFLISYWFRSYYNRPNYLVNFGMYQYIPKNAKVRKKVIRTLIPLLSENKIFFKINLKKIIPHVTIGFITLFINLIGAHPCFFILVNVFANVIFWIMKEISNIFAHIMYILLPYFGRLLFISSKYYCFLMNKTYWDFFVRLLYLKWTIFQINLPFRSYLA